MPLPDGIHCLRIPTPLPLLPGDRFVLRESGRAETVGGGEIVELAPVRVVSKARPDRSVDRVIAGAARRVVEEFGGTLPCDSDILLSFHGVGPKCANLVLGVACGQAHIGVDIHVHRVTNRWGIVKAKTPEKTMEALQHELPQANWVEINALLVPFGKHVCTGFRPKCSTCPLLDMCKQVGVTSHD